VSDKKISLGLSCNDYVETFNSLMRIVHPIRVFPKGFNNSYVFKKGDTLFSQGLQQVVKVGILGF